MQYDDSEPVMDALKFAMTRCKSCTNYDLRHNTLSDEGIEKLVEILKEAEHVMKEGAKISDTHVNLMGTRVIPCQSGQARSAPQVQRNRAQAYLR